MFDRFAQLSRYLTVPLQTAPLLLIGTLGVLMALAVKASLLGIALGVVLLTGLFNYSFVLLDQLVCGKLEAPVMSIEMMNPIEEHRSLLLFVVFVAVFFASDATLYWFGPVFSIVIGVLSLAALLAVIAVQGATGSLSQSLNPLRCLRLMLRLRGDGLFILGCALLLWLLVAVARSLGSPLMLQIALSVYAWLTVVSLVGGALYERRLELGLVDVHEPQTIELDDGAALARARERNFDRIYAEWRGGSHGNAWQSALAAAAQTSDPLTELLWLYERARLWPDQRLANRLAQEILPSLLTQKRTGEALDMLRQRLSASSEFRPVASADLIRLVHIARDAGDRPTARALLRDFQRLYPDDPAGAAATLLMQQLER
jgi:hypothetical protein